MKKVKVSELTGAALDWAVAKCEELPLILDPMGFRKDAPESPQAGWWVWYIEKSPTSQIVGSRLGYSPSKNWSQGGPIIERECIDVRFGGEEDWEASMAAQTVYSTGPTPLVAAMRCYVASKLGDETEVPEELA